MLKSDADLLVAALRSGKYKQGRIYLRNTEDEYCCLGVYAEEKGIPAVFNDDDFCYRFGEDCAGLDPALKLGLSKYGKFLPGVDRSMIRTGTDPSGYKSNSLSALNDAGVSFFDIADFIEKNWEYIL